MLVGAAANPFLTPMELNMLRMRKKVDAGAKFFQTSAVFDVDIFGRWLEARRGKESARSQRFCGCFGPGQRRGSGKAAQDVYGLFHSRRSG